MSPISVQLPRSEVSPESVGGVIFELELSIARRADELARTHGHNQTRDFWMEAEAEILGRERPQVAIV